MVAHYYLAKRSDPRELHNCILGLVSTLAYTMAITNVVKITFGRPRPYFATLCWGEQVAAPKVLDSWRISTFDAYCNDVPQVDLDEARKSFPSGHASISAAGLGYFGLVSAGWLRVFNGEGHPWRLVVATLPGLVAIGIGLTRVADYHHHPTDVLAGLALGAGIAFAHFRLNYKNPLDTDHGEPYYDKQRSFYN